MGRICGDGKEVVGVFGGGGIKEVGEDYKHIQTEQCDEIMEK